MTENLLEVSDLTVRYGAALALEGVSCQVAENGSLAVLGANGAGKSTLARALSGLVPVSAGSIRVRGVELAGRSAARFRRAGIVHLPEGRGVFTSLTVTENLRMGMVLESGGKAARLAAMERAFAIFPALADRRRQLAGTLSGGEQQMLSLARALMIEPAW